MFQNSRSLRGKVPPTFAFSRWSDVAAFIGRGSYSLSVSGPHVSSFHIMNVSIRDVEITPCPAWNIHFILIKHHGSPKWNAQKEKWGLETGASSFFCYAIKQLFSLLVSGHRLKWTSAINEASGLQSVSAPVS